MFRPVPLMIVAGGIIFGWFALLNVIYLTGSYDDFVYHVPSAAYFVQHHSFKHTDVAEVQEGVNSATKLSELLCVWQYFVVRDDALLDFWALGIFVQYVLAVYGLCRELGAGFEGAVFGTFLSAVSPILMFQMLSAQDDLAMCAFFATSLRFAVASWRGRPQRLAVAVSSGLLLSSKLSAPLLCAIVFASFAIFELEWPLNRKCLQTARSIIAMATLAMLLGGWWYLRNTIQLHNPFYPFDARIGGFGVAGHISRSAEMSMLNRELSRLPLAVRLWKLWREEKSHFNLWLYSTDAAYAGFGPAFFVIGMPSLLFASVLMIVGRQWRTASVVLMIIVGYLAFAGNMAPRLSLFILPGVAIGIARMFTASEESYPRLSIGLSSLGICLAIYTFVVAAMSPFDPSSIRNQLRAPQEKDLVSGTFLNRFAPVRTAIPSDATVAYDESTIFLWPLWRSDWSNKVEFIPAPADWAAWKARAAILGVTHVYIGRPGESKMNAWVLDYKEHFKLIAQSHFGVLYAFQP